MAYCAECLRTFDEEDSIDGNCPYCTDYASWAVKNDISEDEVESEMTSAKYDAQVDELEKQARNLSLMVVDPDELGEGLGHQHCLVMTQASGMSSADRASIASNIFTYIQDSTTSLGGRLGFDLAYLLGAIARNIQVRLHLNSPLTKILTKSPHWLTIRPFVASFYEYVMPANANRFRERHRLSLEGNLGVRVEAIERKPRIVKLERASS